MNIGVFVWPKAKIQAALYECRAPGVTYENSGAASLRQAPDFELI